MFKVCNRKDNFASCLDVFDGVGELSDGVVFFFDDIIDMLKPLVNVVDVIVQFFDLDHVVYGHAHAEYAKSQRDSK